MSFFEILNTDGLKDNPLYITSGDVSNAEEGPVYGVVNKSKQTKENVDSDDKKNPGPVHAEVQKSSKHGSVFWSSDIFMVQHKTRYVLLKTHDKIC